MKKSEQIDFLANKTGFAKTDVAKLYDAIFELFGDELEKGNNVAVSGFGTFKQSQRSARTGRNPQTGEEIKIPASKSVSFKVAKALKESLNK